MDGRKLITGIINVKKERGFTSNDVVAKLRGIVHQRKIGHTGTLDPDATGVLPVCLGPATRICDMLKDEDKSYRTVMLLGKVTDTQDISGEVLQESEVTCAEAQVLEAIRSFVGPYDQIPPMYSAKKVGGKKLYELARAGIEIERKSCAVTIHDIIVEKVELPRVTMTVRCSRGTYIRTLCHDIGANLGCGATMESLERLNVGPFGIDEAVTLGEIEQLVKEDRLNEVLLPIDRVFMDLPAVRTADEVGNKRLMNGNPLNKQQIVPVANREEGDANAVAGGTFAKADRIRVYDLAGKFCAVYEKSNKGNYYVPEKMFLVAGSEKT